MARDSTYRFHYPDGFELLFVRNRAAPVLALDLWVRAGSADEAPGEAGLAHLVEHMLFKGTARRGPGVMAREIEGVGGEINAYTSFDQTVYSVVVASRFADLALDVLADAVTHPGFDPDELGREKSVVLEEIRRSRDLPAHQLSRLLFSEMYSVHLYGRPVIGDEETVQGFTREACRGFVRRWYRPRNLTLAVAGDAEAGALARRVGEVFGAGSPRPGLAPRRSRRTRVREPERPGFRAVLQPRDVSEVYFDLAFPGPPASHPQVAALDLLVTLLGQGESSRLQHRVKLDQNLVRAVGAGAYTPRDPGLVYVGGVADASLFPRAYAAICEEVFRLCREPVGLKELERARGSVEADFVFQKETVQGQAQKAGYFHTMLGDVASEERYFDALRRADPDDLRAAARRWLRADRGGLVLIHPKDHGPGLSAAGAADVAARCAGSPGPRPRARGPARSAVSRRELPNGARVLVKANPDVPVVAVRAAFLGGLRREPADQAGAFHVLADALVRGTRSRSVFDIAHEIDGLGGQLDGFSGRNSFGLRGEFLSKYLEDGLELFAEVLCHPVFPEDEVDRLRDDALALLRLRRDNPASYAFRLFEESLYGSHPLGRDPLGLPETLARLGAPGLRALFAAAARPENLAVAVAGDVDPDLVHEFFRRALGELSPAGALPPEPAPPRPPSREVRRRETAPIEQAHLVSGFLGASLRDDDRHALRVANALLSGQGGRLFRALRDEQGLAYAVSSVSTEGLDAGYLAGYIATAPDRAGAARSGLLAEFARLASEEPGADEVAEAQRKLVGTYEIALQENAVQAAQLALDEVYGLGHRGFAAYARDLFAVTPAQVLAAARRYFRPGACVSLTLGP
ncbi:MAG: M16 family metallopeptidase [Deferrisomatales bacterium]